MKPEKVYEAIIGLAEKGIIKITDKTKNRHLFKFTGFQIDAEENFNKTFFLQEVWMKKHNF